MVGQLLKPMRLSPAGLVLLPLAVLILLSSALVLALYLTDSLGAVSPNALLISGALVYAATIFSLSRNNGGDMRGSQAGYHHGGSNVDSLSGLPNRAGLHDDYAAATDNDEEVALALLDLDSFKQVNDHFGHAVGDQLIQKCAQLLREICGDEADCYRLGGDEFAIVMRGPNAGTLVEGISRSLLDHLRSPIMLSERAITVGASVGLARSNPGEALPSSEMLRRADVAMYMSKRGGKMRCTWFDARFDKRREVARELEHDLRGALAAGEFALAYQPLVDAERERIVAVEALLRWNRADGKKIGPDEFIPVAEQSGLINPIGLWVLREAISQAINWDGIALSVNISAAQLRDPEFPIQLGEMLEETGFPAHLLELEVTETCLVVDPVVAERALDVIRKFGVRVSLDDFGTGYASIGFLRQFRFEKLKLDRSLVMQAGEDDGSRAMMLSSIAVARALNMGVTAEGVETNEQAQLVRMAGCDQIQGWLFYKALPANEVDALIAAQNSNITQMDTALRSRANSQQGGY